MTESTPLDPAPDGYADAAAELERILHDIEDDDVDVDVLAERVERAAALIAWCRERILAARSAVDEATSALGPAVDDAVTD